MQIQWFNSVNVLFLHQHDPNDTDIDIRIRPGIEENEPDPTDRTSYLYDSRNRLATRFHLEGAFAVVAPEAGLVVNAVVGGQLVDQVHRLLARHALLGRPCESHDHPSIALTPVLQE